MTDTPRYPVVLEPSATGFGVYVPDLPGCVSVGETREEALEMIAEAIAFHLEGMREDGLDIPAPGSVIEWVEPHAA